MSYPKHIAYRRKKGGKSFHAVARSEAEESAVRQLVDENGYTIAVSQPVAGMTEDEYSQFIELEDRGVRLDRPHRERAKTDVRDNGLTESQQQELPF